jgi:hypothetical protein
MTDLLDIDLLTDQVADLAHLLHGWSSRINGEKYALELVRELIAKSTQVEEVLATKIDAHNRRYGGHDGR